MIRRSFFSLVLLSILGLSNLVITAKELVDEQGDKKIEQIYPDSQTESSKGKTKKNVSAGFELGNLYGRTQI